VAELVVVTGGAYSGKTALVRALGARGCETLPEAAFEVIEELVREHGLEAQLAWREANQVEFQRRVTERQHAREAAARASAAPFVVCDRGVLDGQAYCEQAGVPWPDDLRALAAPARYAHVFVLETLHPFDARRETGRVDTPEASARTGRRLEELYRPRAAALTLVPRAALEERVALVLRALGRATG
jgi:predicted ATPase